MANPHLLIDGYLAKMFSPRGAEEYHTSLLRREPQLIQWHANGNVLASPHIVFTAPPPGLESDEPEHVWTIDLPTRDTGPVIPQQIWTPRKPSDTQRYVYNEQLELHPPVFFVHRDDEGLGLPVTEAAAGNCMHLRGAEQAARVGSSTHAQIRINWRGYPEWDDQIMTQKTPAKETISVEKFAKYVAGKVVKFMKEQAAKTSAYDPKSDQRWRIGDDHITPRNVILIGVVQVSQGSWMPILQLNSGFVLCLGL